MARTKKKELQKVKAEVARNRRQSQNIGAAPCNFVSPATDVKHEVHDTDGPSTQPDQNGVTSEIKVEKVSPKSTPVRSSSRTSSPSKGVNSICKVKAEVTDDGNNVITEDGKGHLEGHQKKTKRIASPRQAVSLPGSPRKKITPIKTSNTWSPRSLRNTSPRSRTKGIRKSRIKSPKNIFEKFESETDSQGESDSGIKSEKISPKNKNNSSKTANIEFDSLTLKKLTVAMGDSNLVDEISNRKQPTGSPEKSTISPKNGSKNNSPREKKRLRSPKLLTGDMILLPLVDRRKLRTPPKSNKKSEEKKNSDDKQALNLKLDVENNLTCAVRKLTFSENENQNKNNNRENLSENVELHSDAPSDLSLVAKTSKPAKKKSCVLTDLIQRMNSRLKIPKGALDSGKVVSSVGLNNSDKIVPEKDGTGDSSDETLPAIDSPEHLKLLSETKSESQEPKASGSQESVATSISSTSGYLETKFIGKYIISKPCGEDENESVQNSSDLESKPSDLKTNDAVSLHSDATNISEKALDSDAKCSKNISEIAVSDFKTCDLVTSDNDNKANENDNTESDSSPFGNILCSLLTQGRKSPVAMETDNPDEEDIKNESTDKVVNLDIITNKLNSVCSSPVKDITSSSSSKPDSASVSPRSKKILETKEPLPISILSRHENTDTCNENLAYHSEELDKYLSIPSNNYAGKENSRLYRMEAENLEVSPIDRKDDYEHFEPDFDEIDGALFLSFSTEEALQAHIKVEAKAKWDKDSSTFLGISRMLEVQKTQESPEQPDGQTPTSHGKSKNLRGQHMRWKKYQRLFHQELKSIFHADEEEDNLDIVTMKTNDITKIKGWRNKYKNKFGTNSGKKRKKNANNNNNNVLEMGNYWSDNEDEPIVLNSSGSELEYYEEGPSVVEYTEDLVPALPEVPQLSRAARKMMIKKLGYDVEDELVILKLGGRRVLIRSGKTKDQDDTTEVVEEADDTPKEKKKRIRRRKCFFARTLTDTMLETALQVLEAPDSRADETGYDHESGVEELPDDLEDKIEENEMVEVFVKLVSTPDITYVVDSEPEEQDQSESQDGGDSKLACDKLGCRYSCICHLCNLTPLLENENQSASNDQPAVCDKEYCRLGCICDSLGHKALVVRSKPEHCGKTTCMLECICDKSKTNSQIDSKVEVDITNNTEEIMSKVQDLENSKINRKGVKSLKEEVKDSKPSKRKKRRSSLLEELEDVVEPDDDPEYKQKLSKKRTERFSNLPKRESTYRVAKNLDAVNRKAMMVYSVSECYSEMRTRKRKGEGSQPEVVIERDDIDDVGMIDEPIDCKPLKKRSRKQSLEFKQDDNEISGVDAIKESVEEAGCELRRVLTMDLPLGSSKLQELHIKPNTANSSVLESCLKTKSEDPSQMQIQAETYSMVSAAKEFLSSTQSEMDSNTNNFDRPKLLREQLMKEKPSQTNVLQMKKFSTDGRWHTQMVCLKPNPRANKSDQDKKSEDEIKLLEFIANCNWDTAKPQILSKVAQCLRPGAYPSTRRMLVGDFYVEILPKANRPPVIPPELKSKLPDMMFSIRIKVTYREEFYQQIMKSQKQSISLKPDETPLQSRAILSVPILNKSNRTSSFYTPPNSTSPVPSASSLPTGGISAFSRLNISQPGQLRFPMSSKSGEKFTFPSNSSEVVDLTMEDHEVHTDKKKRKKHQKPEKSKSKRKKCKNSKETISNHDIFQKSLNNSGPAIVGPFELDELKNLKTADGKTSVLKLVSPNVMIPANIPLPGQVPKITPGKSGKSNAQDLIAVPIQIGAKFNPNSSSPLIACPALPLKDAVIPGSTVPLNLSLKNRDFNGMKIEEELPAKKSSGSKNKLDNTQKSASYKKVSQDYLMCREELGNENELSDVDVDIEELGSDVIHDDDSRSSDFSEVSGYYATSSLSKKDIVLDELDINEEDDDFALKVKKFSHNKIEKIRRQQLNALFIRLKCVVIPEYVPNGSENVAKHKVLQESMTVIQDEEETSAIVAEDLITSKKRNQMLLEKVLNLIETMWQESIPQDVITQALELTNQNVPARLVSKVIDSIEEFSKKHKRTKPKPTQSVTSDFSFKNNCEVVDLTIKPEEFVSESFGQSESVPLIPTSGSMILATLELLNQGGSTVRDDASRTTGSTDYTSTDGLPSSLIVNTHDDQVVDLISDDESDSQSLNSSRSISPVEGVDVDQRATEDSSLDRSYSSTKMDALNSSLPDVEHCDQAVKMDEAADKVASQNCDVSMSSFADKVIDSAFQTPKLCQPDPFQDNSNLTEPEDLRLNVTDNESKSLNSVECMKGVQSETDSETVGSASCDMLALIDKSLPGNLELYEDISDSETNSGDVINSANVNLKSDLHPVLINQSTVFLNNNNAEEPFSNCDSMMCTNDNAAESETSDALFKLTDPKYPLPLYN